MDRLAPLFDHYDQVILDLDGCVWLGGEPVAGSPEAIAALRAAGKRVAFATNNSWHAGEEQVTRLWRIGVQASLADVVTVGAALQHLLAETRVGQSAYVVGAGSLRVHVRDAGLRVVNGHDDADRADVVVVGGTEEFDYPTLRTAALAVRRGAALLATNRDAILPMPEGPWPGTGALVSAIEIASGEQAEVVGKPRAQLLLTAMDRLGEGRTLMVGDRLDSDAAAAGAAGIDCALVLSGPDPGERPADVPEPVATADDLATLVGVSGRR